MKKLSILILAALLLAGCSMKWKQGTCKKWGVCSTVSDSIHIIDSTFLVPVPYTINGDTAWLTAYLECDSANNVVQRSYQLTNGKYLRLMQDIKNGVFSVTSYLPAIHDTAYVQGRIQIYWRKVVEHQLTNLLTGWQTFQVGAFWPMAAGNLLFIVLIVWLVIRWIKRIGRLF